MSSWATLRKSFVQNCVNGVYNLLNLHYLKHLALTKMCILVKVTARKLFPRSPCKNEDI